MKRIKTPDSRQQDPGDPDRHSPSTTDDEGGLETGIEGNIRAWTGAGGGPRDPRAQGKRTRSPDETATRRHLESSEQGPT